MKYKRDFLDRVICRADFDVPLQIAKSGPPESVYKMIKERFPMVESKNYIGKQLIVGPAGSKEEEIEHNEWVYYGINRLKDLKIARNALVVEYFKYEYFKNLKEDFLNAINAIDEEFGPVRISRLGLRYIDRIEKSVISRSGSWSNILIEPLVSNLSIASDPGTLARSFTVVEFNYGSSRLKFQYGIHNEDFPAPIKEQPFILDYDMSTNQLLEIREVSDTLDKFHDKLIESFEEVITDNLRKTMEPIDERQRIRS